MRCCATSSPAVFPTRYAGKAAELLAEVEPDSAVAAARVELASDLVDDLRRVDGQLAESKKRLEQVVAASGTTVIDIFGVGPVVAATVVGVTGDIARFPTRDRFAAFNGTAPIEVSSGGRKVWRLSRRRNRTLNHAIHMAASPRSGGRTAVGAATTTARSPGARHRRKRCGRSSAASATPSGLPWSPTPGTPQLRRSRRRRRAREGNPGNDSVASAAGSHPDTPALRPSHSRTRPKATTTEAGSHDTENASEDPKDNLTNKEDSIWHP